MDLETGKKLTEGTYELETKFDGDQPYLIGYLNNETGSTEKEDMVNHPPHYIKGDMECIDWIEAALTPEEFRGYLKGSILKYFWRHEDKGSPVLDLGKLGWYAEHLKEKWAELIASY